MEGWAVFMLLNLLFVLAIQGTQMFNHARFCARPGLQKCYFRLISIVPVFALTSLLSHSFPHYGYFFDTVRGLTEAFALFHFYSMMILFSGGEKRVITVYEEPRNAAEYRWKWFCLSWNNAPALYKFHQRCVSQLIITKPLFTGAIAFLSLRQPTNKTQELLIFLCQISNLICISLLMYALLVVYRCCGPALSGLEAGKKFAAIKLLVFVGVLQSFAAASALQSGEWQDNQQYSAEEQGSSFSLHPAIRLLTSPNFWGLIAEVRFLSRLQSVEMTLFALIYATMFPYNDTALFPRIPRKSSEPNGALAAATADFSDAVRSESNYQSFTDSEVVPVPVVPSISAPATSPHAIGTYKKKWKYILRLQYLPLRRAWPILLKIWDVFTKPIEEREIQPALVQADASEPLASSL